MPERPESVTMHSSWRGIIGASLGAIVLLLITSFIVAAAGFNLITTTLLVIGIVAVVGTAYDYPIRSTFDAEGVVRRSMLRHHRIAWVDVNQLSRARPSLMGFKGLKMGGLVVISGKRKFLLVDQVESGGEYDDLELLLEDLLHDLDFQVVIRPSDEVSPTWIYRRKHWQPRND